MFHLFLPFYILPHLSYLLPPLFYYWIPPDLTFLISLIALFIIYWLFFISSRSLLNLSCIFSVLVSRLLSVIPFCFQGFGSFLLSLFGIIYQVDSLSLPLWFGGHLSFSFTCLLFLCLFSLFRLLCLGWPFYILAVSVFWPFCILYSSLLWRFLSVGGVGQVACQGFLVRKLVSVF